MPWAENTEAPKARDQMVEPRYLNVEAWVTHWRAQLVRRHTNTKRSGVELACQDQDRRHDEVDATSPSTRMNTPMRIGAIVKETRVIMPHHPLLGRG